MNTRALLLAPLLLTACEVGPDFKMPSLDLPSSWSGEATPAPVAPQATAAETTVPREWWKAFNDPALTTLVEEGLAANSDLLLAAARVSEARANLNLADANQYPQINGQAGATRTKPSAETLALAAGKPRNDFNVAAVLNYEIDLWGRLSRAKESARATLLSNQANRDAIRLAVASDIASGYFNLLALDAQIDVTKQTIASRAKSSDYEIRRYKNGAINALTYQQAQAELAAAQAALPVLTQNRVAQQNALALLLGRSPRDLVEKPLTRGNALDALPVPPTIPTNLPSTLLERRPDIASAEQDMIAANAQIGVATANYFPKISISALIGLDSVKSENLFQSSARNWQVGGNLLGPLLDAGRTTANVDAAKSRSEVAQITYQQTVRAAFADVLNSLSAVQTTQASVTAQTAQVTARSEAARIATKRYDAGYSDQLELLDTQRNLYQAQLASILATRDRLSATVTLYKALGGGWNIADSNTAPQH